MSWLSSTSISLGQVEEPNKLINAESCPRVAVFLGATSGIGHATLTNLVSRGQPIKAYVIGRNAARYESQLTSLRDSNPNAEIIFLEGQISLLRDVNRLCAEIISREKTINALFMSSGYLPMNGRQETEEGLDTCLVVTYYARMLFVRRLLSLLRNGSNPRIVSVLAAGLETDDVDVTDLDFEKPGRVTSMPFARQVATYTTVVLNRIAESEPNVTVVHAHPGSVGTGALGGERGIQGRFLGPLVRTLVEPVVNLISFTPEQSGQRCVFVLTSSRYGGHGTPLPNSVAQATNVYGKGSQGAVFLEDMGMKSVQQEALLSKFKADGADEKIWFHFVATIDKYSR